MQKIINPGTIDAHDGRSTPAQVFCKIKYTDGRLSISGVVGPTRNGNARGSCGQIDGTLKDAIIAGEYTPAAGWDAQLFARFINTWDAWHLNDMRPYCAHQGAAGWRAAASEEVKIYHWILKPEVYKQKKALEAEALERARSVDPGRSVGFYAQERAIMRLELSKTTDTAELSPADARYYGPDINLRSGAQEIETKTRGWVNYKDDVRGLLGKACPDCGYTYGSAWVTEAVPAPVLEFLESLPETKITPAWV